MRVLLSSTASIIVLLFPLTLVADDNLTTDEMIDQAEERLQRMYNIMEQTLDLIEDAGDGQDQKRLKCLNDKLAAIKSFLNFADQAMVDLKEAAARGDQDVAQKQYGFIAGTADKLEELKAEVNTCGETIVTDTRGTKVSVTVDEGIVESDPTDDTNFEEDVERLPESSPYQ